MRDLVKRGQGHQRAAAAQHPLHPRYEPWPLCGRAAARQKCHPQPRLLSTHNRIIPAQVEALELAHPEAEVCAHPECTREILDEADYIGSTKQIIEHIAASDAREFIVLTVVGVAAEIARQTAGQDKHVYFPATPPICPNMAMVGPEKVLAALETGAGEVELPANAEGAMAPLERMLELAAR